LNVFEGQLSSQPDKMNFLHGLDSLIAFYCILNSRGLSQRRIKAKRINKKNNTLCCRLHSSQNRGERGMGTVGSGGWAEKVGRTYSVKDTIESTFAFWILVMKAIPLFVGNDQ
jgi:hypothetical protein